MLTETVNYAIAPGVLRDKIALALDGLASSVEVAFGEVTVLVPASFYLQAAQILRDVSDCRFEQMIDLCGMDMSAYGDGRWEGARFVVILHLLSITSKIGRASCRERV